MKRSTHFRRWQAGALCAVVLYGVLGIAPSVIKAEDPDALRRSIEEKSKALEEVLAQRAEVQRTLDTLTESRQTLSRDVKVIDSTVSELTYAIRANELTLERLGLEIESLRGLMDEHKTTIDTRRETIVALIRAIDEVEQENPFMAFLRHGTLSNGVSLATQAIVLSNRLTIAVQELREAEGELAKTVHEREVAQRTEAREQQTLASRKVILSDQRASKQELITQTKNKEQVYATQLSELQKIQDQISLEISKVEEELRRTINPDALPTPRPGVLGFPVPSPRLTQDHGATAFAQRAYKSKWHNGVDFGAPVGTEVYAAESGRIINAGNQDAYRGCYKAAYGKFIVVKHDNGLTTLYGHLSRIQVSIGDRIERGDVIGYIGSTGYATGPHLHFTVFASQTLSPAKAGYPEGTKPSSCGPMPVGGDLDPMDYLPSL